MFLKYAGDIVIIAEKCNIVLDFQGINWTKLSALRSSQVIKSSKNSIFFRKKIKYFWYIKMYFVLNIANNLDTNIKVRN